jgi:putative ABC transport system permease protein
VAFTLTLPGARYPNGQARLLAFNEIERRLREQPGVQSVGASSTIALRGYTWTGDATVEGRAPTDYERELRHQSVSPDYFKTMGIRLLEGRWFDGRDLLAPFGPPGAAPAQPPTVVVNEALAKKYFRGADALGKRITYGRPQDNNPWITIVGVVADEKQDGLDKPAQPAAYTSVAAQTSNPLTFVMRTSLPTESAIALARQQVGAVDKDLALTDVTTMQAVVDESMGDHRFRTTLLSAFAGIALFLAALGIYGVLSYFVSQRSRELGIRLALGAKRSALFALVIGQGIRPVVAGAVIGLAGAMALTSVMQTLLFGVQALDPPTYAMALALLGTIAITACAVPALRATQVDPLVALRDE